MNAAKPGFFRRMCSGLTGPLQRPLRRLQPGPDGPGQWASGFKQGFLLGAAVLAVVLPQARQVAPVERASVAALAPASPSARAWPPRLDLGEQTASAEVLQLAQWVLDNADHRQRPFVILDKKDARAFVIEPSGRLRAATPVLLGYAQGDDSVAGIGQRPIADVRPEERTTPAGRFLARPGRNASNEEVLWVDYEAAVSMHRVRPTDPRERRLQRLASPLASERRISYGCINMPVVFFEQVLWPIFGRQGGMVYVLPEIKALNEVFPQLAAQRRSAHHLMTQAPGAAGSSS